MSSKMHRSTVEATLDPEDWEEIRTLGHHMIDDMLDYTKNIRSQPTRNPTKKALEEIHTPLTEDGEGEEQVYEVFRRSILPYTVPLTSPRFWGIVAGQGSPYGMLVEMLRAGMNGAQEFSHAEAEVNAQVIDWIKEMLGFPKASGGVLVSGGSEANFTGLAVARNAMSKIDVKTKGVQSLDQKMVLYCGDETHECLERSVELLGFGNEALRRVPTDEHFRIDVERLKDSISEDREQGLHPFCIIGCAGTTNTGSFDDLTALADIAREQKMWFHIDGAFGAWVKISRTHHPLAEGMERADSLAVDMHKWMNMPYAIGCTLVKDRRAHLSTFVYGHEAEYLRSAFDLSEDKLGNPHNLALPLSRNFSSLKAYMLLRAFGRKRYQDLVQQNLDQAAYLARSIEEDEEMELTAPVASNVVCFRYSRPNQSERQLQKLNKRIIQHLDEDHYLMISDTTIKGKYTLRACIVNHRTRQQDLDFMIREIKRFGRGESSR
jgi:aromatic-L-amino-acid decarboxylase